MNGHWFNEAYLPGKRWPVSADGRRNAITKAKTRKWWKYCTLKEPIYEHGLWWFVANQNPEDFIVKTDTVVTKCPPSKIE